MLQLNMTRNKKNSRLEVSVLETWKSEETLLYNAIEGLYKKQNIRIQFCEEPAPY